jgi:heparosan-N-sulfate-glucuronate 5-epimerase
MKKKIHLIFIAISLILAVPFTSLTEDIINEKYRIYYSSSSLTNISTDRDGIPIVDYGYKNGVYIGEQRYAITISQKALKYYETIGNNDDSYDKFIACADWLVNNSISYGNYSVWESTFPWPSYNLSSPWVSGMAQGQGIQVLVRAYNITHDEKYLKAADSSLEAFYIDVKDGGVTYKDEEGWWFEEYAQANNTIQPRVLNGFMFALVGINDYYEYTKDERAKYLLEMGSKDLKNQLEEYDTGSWTYYDHLGLKASEPYHLIHIELLSDLYKITGDSYFKNYSEKWAKYEKSPLSIYYRNPGNVKIYFANLIGLIICIECFWIFGKMRNQIIK